MQHHSDQEAPIRSSVGAKIRELRKARRMTSLDLASQAGISQSQLSKIETGKASISIKMLNQLCQVLERPLSYLFQSEQEVPRVLGTLVTVAGPENQGLSWFAEEVRRRTLGRMSLIPLRAPQLGSGVDQVDQLRQGVIDLFVEELAYYQNHAPALNMLSLPYSFPREQDLNAFLASELFERGVRAPLLERGIRFINRSWNWRRGIEWVLVAPSPVRHPDQLRGLRVRIYDSPVLAHFWREMGAQPVVVPWPDVKSALKRGEVDVLPTHKAHLFPLGFCRHARYVTLLGDICPPLGVAVNELKYRVLPPDIQGAIEEACETAGEHFTELVKNAEIKNESLNISKFNAQYLRVDIGPWREASRRVRRSLAARGLCPSGAEESAASDRKRRPRASAERS